MPYVKPEKRPGLHDSTVDTVEPKDPGELNYLLTVLVRNYFHDHGEDYQAINDVVGALQGALLEFYRRVAVPYEEGKMEQNGDVYDE